MPVCQVVGRAGSGAYNQVETVPASRWRSRLAIIRSRAPIRRAWNRVYSAIPHCVCGLTVLFSIRFRTEVDYDSEITMARREPAPTTGGDISTCARRIVDEFHSEYEPTFEVLQHLADDLPSLQSTSDPLSDSDKLEYAARILRAAFRHMPWQDAVEYLESTPASLVEDRIWISYYLADTDGETRSVSSPRWRRPAGTSYRRATTRLAPSNELPSFAQSETYYATAARL